MESRDTEITCFPFGRQHHRGLRCRWTFPPDRMAARPAHGRSVVPRNVTAGQSTDTLSVPGLGLDKWQYMATRLDRRAGCVCRRGWGRPHRPGGTTRPSGGDSESDVPGWRVDLA